MATNSDQLEGLGEVLDHEELVGPARGARPVTTRQDCCPLVGLDRYLLCAPNLALRALHERRWFASRAVMGVG